MKSEHLDLPASFVFKGQLPHLLFAILMVAGLFSLAQPGLSGGAWYTLLQANPFIALSLLAFFDLVNYLLIGVMFLALAARLWQINRLLLVALAGLFFSLMLLPSHRGTAILGLLAGDCDLAYGLVFPLTPMAPVYLLLAAAGLFWMLWHVLAARVLFKYAKERQ